MKRIFLALFFLTGSALIAAPKPAAAPKIQVAFIAELIDGKKFWTVVPTDVVLKKGSKIHAKIVNTLGEPHGFEIKGMVDPMIIAPGAQVLDFTVPQKVSGEQKVTCQLHPAHQAGAFQVK